MLAVNEALSIEKESGTPAGDGSVRARLGAVEGPRERLLRLGAPALTDPELLAVLFGTGMRGTPVLSLAESVIVLGGGLKAISQRDPAELCSIAGLGPARAAQVAAALELGRRVIHAPERRQRLATARDIVRYLTPLLAARRVEQFHVLCFNPRNVLLRDVCVAQGMVDQCPVDLREVFVPAISTRASAIVVAHNHPSGYPEPSPLDLTLTQQLVDAGQVLGIKLLDHLIVGDGNFVSLRERGFIRRDPSWNAGY